MEKREKFAQELAEILVKQGSISDAEGRSMQRTFKNSDRDNFEEFLLDEGLVEEASLLKALGEYYQVPYEDVTGYYFDNELVRNFPKDFLLRNVIVPLEMEDDELICVASNPSNPDLVSGMGAYTSEDIQFRVGLARDITDAIKEYYDKSLTDVMDDQDYQDEQLVEKERYHSLISQEDEDAIAIQQDIDNEE